MEQAGKGLQPTFQGDQYVFRKKVFKLLGGAIHVYDRAGNVVLYSEQKAFKLREDFRVYADVNKSQELLTIKTPQILDLSAIYTVRDASSGEDVGALRRKGIKSILKDEWILLSADGAQIGKMTECSMVGALLSRFINLIPQSYAIRSLDERDVAELKMHFNPFILKYTLTILNPQSGIDRRLLIAAGILLSAIERRQQ